MLTFERLMGGVTPMEHRKGVQLVPSSQTAGSSGSAKQRAAKLWEQEQRLEADARARLHALVEDGVAFEVRDDGRRVQGRRRGTDGGAIRRMSQGQMVMDGTFDLRHASGPSAQGQTEQFVARARARGDKAVLIVFSENRGAGTSGILRGELAAWLSEGKASKHVDAFCTAPDQLGGEDAMCVLLKGAR